MQLRSGGRGAGFAPARRRLSAVLALLATACGANQLATEEGHEVEQSIEQVMARRVPELMRIDGVTGVGQGLCDGTPCIRVFVTGDTVAERLPASMDGYTVSYVVTGVIRPSVDP